MLTFFKKVFLSCLGIQGGVQNQDIKLSSNPLFFNRKSIVIRKYGKYSRLRDFYVKCREQ